MIKTRTLLAIFCSGMLIAGLGACSDDESDPVTPPGDETAPQVLSTYPVHGSGGWDRDEEMEITFSEPIDEDSATGNITITGGTLTGTRWESDRELVIEHDVFTMETDITVTVGTGLADLAGNNLATAYTFGFLTESDNLIVMGTSPGNGETGIFLNTGITLRFSDSVGNSEIEDWVFLSDIIVTKNGGEKANFDFSVEGLGNGSYLLTPDAPLPAETLIYVYVSDQIQTGDGRNPAEPYLVSFTTGTDLDITPPSVVGIVPAHGTMNVPGDQGFLRITFSEPVEPDDIGGIWDLRDYNLSFRALLESEGYDKWEWNGDFTEVTVPLPTDLPAGLPIHFTITNVDDLNGVEQDVDFDYSVKVAGSADYLPFADGQRFVDNGPWSEGVIGNPTPIDDGWDNTWIEIDFQGDGSFREVEYAQPQFMEQPFQNPTGGWDAFRIRSNAFQWLGWQEAEQTGPQKSNDFSSPVTVLPLPISAGTWTSTATVVVEGEGGGTFDATLSGRVLPQQDYHNINYDLKGMDGSFVKDAWIVVLDIEARVGTELMITQQDTVVYAPTLGPVKTVSSSQNFDENEWNKEWSERHRYRDRGIRVK